MLFSDVIHDVNDDTEASLGEIREKLLLVEQSFEI